MQRNCIYKRRRRDERETASCRESTMHNTCTVWRELCKMIRNTVVTEEMLNAQKNGNNTKVQHYALSDCYCMWVKRDELGRLHSCCREKVVMKKRLVSFAEKLARKPFTLLRKHEENKKWITGLFASEDCQHGDCRRSLQSCSTHHVMRIPSSRKCRCVEEWENEN